MNRLAVAALIVVVAIGAVGLVAGFSESGTPAAAQDEGDTAVTPDFVPVRPEQIEDPGELRVSTGGWSTNFDISSVPFNEISGGGPGKDGIPAIDDPRFESIEEAREWIGGKGPVIALEIGGDARAYPLAVLTWHEIANDVVGGVPVTVTFCPLCHTALVYERALDGTVHDFGVSGNLRFSDMVMYDRQTETWWQQATGKGIVGDLTGAKLTFVPSQLIGLDQFAEAYPDGVVMSRETGHNRSYGRNPYAGYDTPDQQPFLFSGVTDGRVAAKERVVTLGEQETETPIAFPMSELRSTGTANVDFDGEPVVAFWVPGANSALGASSIADAEDTGSTGVFSRLLDDEVLTFVREGDDDAPITDVETGSTWDITGRAIDGPLSGSRLDHVAHGDHFWFAWAAFVPQTNIWTANGTISLDGLGGE